MGHKSDMAGAQIAVVIAAYNAEATLDRAVASALAQPETAEVCIVDDRSTDATPQLAAAWGLRDSRVRALRNDVNAGPGASRNAAIAVTTAPWIAILDADDYLQAGRFSKLLADADDADFVADELIRTAEGGTPAAPAAPPSWSRLDFEHFVLGSLGALKDRWTWVF